MEVLRSAAEIKTKEVQESKETAEILFKQVNEEKAIAEEELSAAEVILKEAEEAVKVKREREYFMLCHIELKSSFLLNQIERR
jgi:hypothetical protein